MSSTGHYTRYINQYPGWSDNNDTMVHHFPDFPGYFQVEHFPGNKRAFAVYDSFVCGGNNAPDLVSICTYTIMRGIRQFSMFSKLCRISGKN